jgi:hypothetical protein
MINSENTPNEEVEVILSLHASVNFFVRYSPGLNIFFFFRNLFGLAKKTTATSDFNHDFSKPLVSENISPKFSSKLFSYFFHLKLLFSLKDSAFSPFTPYIVLFVFVPALYFRICF